MLKETPTERREMADWQRICYGDTDAARAALAFYREHGWPVDADTFPERTWCEGRIYDFISGYKAAQAALKQVAAYLRQSCATCQHADTRDTIDGWCFCAPPRHEPRYPFIGKGMPLDEKCKGWTPKEDQE